MFPLASSVYRVKGEIPSVHPMQMYASKKPVEYKESYKIVMPQAVQTYDAAGIWHTVVCGCTSEQPVVRRLRLWRLLCFSSDDDSPPA